MISSVSYCQTLDFPLRAERSQSHASSLRRATERYKMTRDCLDKRRLMFCSELFK